MLYRAPQTDWDQIPVSTGFTANPAAGADCAEVTVTTGKKWLLLSCYAVITTDANVADRYPSLYVQQDGSTNNFKLVGATPVTANITSQSVTFMDAAAGGLVANSGALVVPFAPTELLAGAQFRLQFMNIQAGDDIGAMVYTYKEAPV